MGTEKTFENDMCGFRFAVSPIQKNFFADMAKLAADFYMSFIETVDSDVSFDHSLTDDISTKRYRTASKAVSIAKMPENYAIITNAAYAPALKTAYGASKAEETAYLMQIREDAMLTFEDGIAYIFSKAASETDFKNYITHERVDSLDIPLLTSLFTIMYQNIGKSLTEIESEDDLKRDLMNYGVDIYIPDFMEYRGAGRNYSGKQIESVLKNIASFHNTIGIVEVRKYGRTYQDGYMLLLTSSIRKSDNTIHVVSPYMNMLIYKIFQQSIVRDKKTNEPKYTASGAIKTSKVYSFQDKRLSTARNKKAVEIVTVVVGLIETTGRNGTPHISVSKIIERCPSLREALEKYKNNHDKTQLLRRSFSEAWKYIRDYTDLQERYGIRIPEMKDTPTINTLGRIYEFPKSE